MKTSIQIGKIMGIPIKLHITFLLILPVFALVFASSPAPYGFVEVESTIVRYAFGTLAAVALFACVLLHELGHSYVAMKYGTKIRSITLLLFGGVASMEEVPRDPKIELKMAMSGPGVSFALGVAFLLIYLLLKPIWAESPVTQLVFVLGLLNVILCGFNLIPAFPMDGGRILRAYLARQMPYMEATRKAVYIGKTFAFAMGVFGFLILSPILILIAFFVYIGASEEEKTTEITVTLEGVKVRDIMTKNVISVPPTMTVSELAELMFMEKHMGYPVVDGRLRGVVTFSDVRQVPIEQRGKTLVGDVMTKKIISVAPDDDAINALKMMSQRNIGRVLVMEDGAMVGIVSRTDLIRSIQLLRE
ncbi:MAG: CBS domain-containing protein [Methanocellales archaeon]|nr:CBS domain-containing protein [Methanocellales archaeon]